MDLKHRIPLHRKLFWGLTGFFFLFFSSFFFFQYKREKNYKLESLNHQLQVFNLCLGEAIRYGTSYADAAAGLIPQGSESAFSGLRVTVIDTLGRVLYDSEADEHTMANHGSRPEVREAMRRGQAYTVYRISEEMNRPYFYSAMSADSLIIRTSIPYTLSLRTILQADRHFIWLILSLACFLTLLAYFYTRRLGHSIRRLQEFAARIERGADFSGIQDFPNDELGQISRHLVRLYGELKESREQQAILKKQLTQNINHELKTPVSIIKGYLETLLENPGLPKEKARDFMQKSYAQVNRLTRLMNDIAVITRMDEGAAFIDREPVCLTSIVREVFSDMEHRIQEAGFEVSVDVPEQMPLQGNVSLLDSIFRNLVDNALSYSGGNRISLYAVRTDEGYRFVFRDNGVGIPAEHRARIFERFYRIDKGRSRRMGGTGLGLSIVKNAVLIHGGTIQALAAPGGGAEFRFTLSDGQV